VLATVVDGVCFWLQVVRWGRLVYANIQKFIQFQLSVIKGGRSVIGSVSVWFSRLLMKLVDRHVSIKMVICKGEITVKILRNNNAHSR
jgi:hypothetical protein